MEFSEVKNDYRFVLNNALFVKRSSRTAGLVDYPSLWFYFSKNERVKLASFQPKEQDNA